MAARVLLLMTCTTLFAAAWESDRPRGNRSVAADVRRQRELNVTSAEADFSQCVIPADIAPGQYRVIDARGQVGWLNVPADERAGTARLWADMMTSESSHGRWYFVRVTDTRSIASTPSATPARQ